MGMRERERERKIINEGGKVFMIRKEVIKIIINNVFGKIKGVKKEVR